MNTETEKKRIKILNALLIVSLTLNISIGGILAIKTINSPVNRLGILKNDTKIIIPKELSKRESISIVLPKGMVVKDASPRGFDRIYLMEPFRFQITFVSDEGIDLVDYSIDKRKFINFSSFYGAKIENNK